MQRYAGGVAHGETCTSPRAFGATRWIKPRSAISLNASGSGAVVCTASPASGVAHELSAPDPRTTLPDCSFTACGLEPAPHCASHGSASKHHQPRVAAQCHAPGVHRFHRTGSGQGSPPQGEYTAACGRSLARDALERVAGAAQPRTDSGSTGTVPVGTGQCAHD